MFIQFIVSMIATLSFAVLFCAPKSELLFCGLTGAIGWIVYLICLQFDTGTVIANMIATLALTVFSRVVAALRKNPVTIYLIAGIFPLVPGAGIYSCRNTKSGENRIDHVDRAGEIIAVKEIAD